MRTACSLSLSTCPGLQFRPHYFIVLLPPVAIFSAVAGSQLLDFAQRSMMTHRSDGRPAPRPWLAIVLLVAVGALIVWPQREFFFQRTPAQACRAVYGPEPFVESPAIAAYISRHSTPDQTMVVLGSEPQLYFYAGRHSATGYIFTYALMEHQPFAERMRQEMCHEVEAAKAEFLVLVDIPSCVVAHGRRRSAHARIGAPLRPQPLPRRGPGRHHLHGAVGLPLG